MRKSKTPAWLQFPFTVAIRSAMTPALAIGLEPAMGIARALGHLVPRFQQHRFQRAIDNLTVAFPDWPAEKVNEYALKSYQHLFQLGVEIAYSPRLVTEEGFTRHLIFTKVQDSVRALLGDRPVILVSGHVGNWELIGYSISMLGFPLHAVYRPFDLTPLDTWMRDTRERRGLTLVSKFGAYRALVPVLRAGGTVGLVADQSGGDRGIFTPFFGRLTSTYKSVGLLAMQTGAQIVCGMARRLRPGEDPPPGPWLDTPARGRQFHARDCPSLRYSVELVDMFGPEDWSQSPDPLFYLTARYRRAIELMVRSAPEQYFWMHRIWRSRPAHERLQKPFPQSLKDKLASLPWMTTADVDAVIERSRKDALAISKG